MLYRALLPAVLFFPLLPCCQQQQLDRCTVEEMRFYGHDEAAQVKALARLCAYMAPLERSIDCDADELAEGSMLMQGNSPAAFLSEDELEEAEEAYLELEAETRIRLAADVMHALLTSPSYEIGGRQLYSYHRLNIRPWLPDAGEYFAPCEDPCIANNREALFKRMVVRIMLEDVACNPALNADQRCAALVCLRHICREGMMVEDGVWDKLYMIDALPIDRRHSGFENALFSGSAAWEE